jgi:hypothetical protein
MSNMAFWMACTDRAGYNDHRCDRSEWHPQNRGKDGHGGEHHYQADDIAEIHRRDEAPDKVFMLHEQKRPGVEAPHHQSTKQNGGSPRAGNSQSQHRQQRGRA